MGLSRHKEQRHLLEKDKILFMISKNKLEAILSVALKKGGEWADIFIEETVKNNAQLSDKKIKNVSRQHLTGAGLRVVSQLKEFYAYTNDLTESGLIKASLALADAVSRQVSSQKINLEEVVNNIHRQPQKSFDQIAWDKRVELLKRADILCRDVSSQITQVSASYMDETQKVWIANSNGLFKNDERHRCRLSISAIASDGPEKQVGYEAPGAFKGYEFFENLELEPLCRQTSERAVRMLTAAYAPQGKMPVIIDSGFGGVIFHEACGHSLEASAVAKKATVFADKLGQKIASPLVSAVDDATLESEWGSAALDDEGSVTRKNVLIENGVLKSYLVDRLNGERIGQASTGSSRRQSYQYSPTSRMNNTFILPGAHTLSQMIAETDYGLYAKKLGGGSVNPITGEFNFAVTEGYVIRNGCIAELVRGAVLIGRGDEVLMKIDRVGNELQLAQGVCGAASGWVPVDVGQPAIRVSEILVGGR
ncbi:MAG: hypothetical protein ACD_73C00511G0004 [uncultured bacterium]|nr:MAG: hypothetical protein ACD_73C00511G0004 [uncultured bacterium]